MGEHGSDGVGHVQHVNTHGRISGNLRFLPVGIEQVWTRGQSDGTRLKTGNNKAQGKHLGICRLPSAPCEHAWRNLRGICDFSALACEQVWRLPQSCASVEREEIVQPQAARWGGCQVAFAPCEHVWRNLRGICGFWRLACEQVWRRPGSAGCHVRHVSTHGGISGEYADFRRWHVSKHGGADGWMAPG